MNGQAVENVAGLEVDKPVATMSTSKLIRWGMYALMAFPIVDFALRQKGVHPLGLIWDKVVLLILVVATIVRILTGTRPTWLKWNKFAFGYIVFVLALMFAGMATPLVAIQGFRIDVYYILYAFFIPVVVEPKDVPKLLHIGVMVATLIGIDGVYQYITRAPMPSEWVNVGEQVRTRVYSVLQSPNELGAYMALVIPIIAGLFIYERHKIRKWLYGFAIVVCGLSLLFTSTRGAWVALILGLAIVALLFERKLFIALIVLCVVGYFLPPIHHRVQELFSQVYWIKSAQAGRIARWLMAFDKMATNPLFGVGVGHYGGAVSAIYHSGIYSDNYYAKTLGETGLVGLSLFFTMHVALLVELYRKVIKHVRGRIRFVFIGGMAGLIAVLIHNTMENVFEFAPMAIAYFIFASLLFVWGIDVAAKEGNHEE